MDFMRLFKSLRRFAGLGSLVIGIWVIAALAMICATALNARFDLGWRIGWDEAILGVKMLAGAMVVGVFWRAGSKALALVDDTVAGRD